MNGFERPFAAAIALPFSKEFVMGFLLQFIRDRYRAGIAKPSQVSELIGNAAKSRLSTILNGKWMPAVLAIVFVMLLAGHSAYADCVPGVGTLKASETEQTIAVSWTLTGCTGYKKVTVELRGDNGTAPYYRNGTLLGTEGPLTNFENGGAVTSTSLTPYHTYKFHVCAVFGAEPAIYCSKVYGMQWQPPQGTPKPTITSPSSTQTSVTFSWTTFPQYTTYNVKLNDGDQTPVSGPPHTFGNLDAQTPYQVSVEGCIGQGVFNSSNCSGFTADYTITTANAAAVAGPQNLTATASEAPGGQFIVSVTWMVPTAEQSQVIQTIKKLSGGGQSNFTPVQNGEDYRYDDSNVSAGQNLIYQVCFQDIYHPSSAPVCGTASIYLPTACSFALSCAINQGNPPTWTMSCGKPKDFYTDTGTPINLSTPNPANLQPISKGAESASGLAVDEPVSVEACVPGTTNQCTGQSIYVSRGQWCNPVQPPKPPPPVNCKTCVENGGQCLTVNHKKVCRNL